MRHEAWRGISWYLLLATALVAACGGAPEDELDDVGQQRQQVGLLKETVTCQFSGTKLQQTCRGRFVGKLILTEPLAPPVVGPKPPPPAGDFGCTGVGSCKAAVAGPMGSLIAWEATGSPTTATTTITGVPKTLVFHYLARTALLTRGPWIGAPKAKGATVRWETDRSALAYLRVGTSWTLGSTTKYSYTVGGATVDRWQHSVTWARASAGAKVTASVEDLKTAAAVSFTATPTAATPFRFAAYGDFQGGDAAVHQSITTQLAAAAPALYLQTGDLAPSGATDAQWYQVFDTSTTLMASAALLPALGNNDPSLMWSRFFATPAAAGVPYYKVLHGTTLFLVGAATLPYTSGSPQHDFFKAALDAAAVNAGVDNIVVVSHRPPYTYSSGGNAPDADFAADVVPHFNAKVRLVLSGHNHFYQRLLKGGRTYLVIGGGGAPSYTPTSPVGSGVQVISTQRHYVIVDVNGKTLQVQVWRHDGGALLDAFTILG